MMDTLEMLRLKVRHNKEIIEDMDTDTIKASFFTALILENDLTSLKLTIGDLIVDELLNQQS